MELCGYMYELCEALINNYGPGPETNVVHTAWLLKSSHSKFNFSMNYENRSNPTIMEIIQTQISFWESTPLFGLTPLSSAVTAGGIKTT